MSWRRRLLETIGRHPVAEDVDKELAFHIEERVREFRALGMTEPEARNEALRRMGDYKQVRAVCRDIRTEKERTVKRAELLSDMAQDLAYALRMLRRYPAITVIAVLTLALGVGANTAIFSVVHSVVLSPLPYPGAEQLVFQWESTRDMSQIAISYQNHLDRRARVRTLEDLAVYNASDQFTLTGRGDAERVQGALGTANLFSVLRVAPVKGRVFTNADDRPGADRVALLTHSYWRLRFAADPSIIGQSLMLDGMSYTIVGVLPEYFRLGYREVWVPLGLFSDLPRFSDRANHSGLIGIGRLKPGVTIEAMRTDLDRVSAEIERENPQNAGIGASGAQLREVVLGDIGDGLTVLSGAVALVLLIACANVANLLLGRSAARQREFALRVALGAGRARLARQLLTESLVLALFGGAAGLALAWGGVKLLLALRPGFLPRIAEIGVHPPALLFALGITLLAGVLFGLAPIVQVMRGDPTGGLHDAGRGATMGRSPLRFRGGLVVAEIALALVLVTSASVLLRSFARLTGVDTGVKPDQITAARVRLSAASYPDSLRRRAALEAVVERVRILPGIEAAAMASDLPISSSWQSTMTFDGEPEPAPGTQPLINGVMASTGYFETVGMRLQSGRGFETSDVASSLPVIVVSESVSRRFLRGADPIGRRAKFGGPETPGPWYTIVGVVNDVKDGGLSAESRGAMYFPMAQGNSSGGWLIVRSAPTAGDVAPMLRRAMAEIDANVPLSNLTTLREAIAGTVSEPRFSALMIGLAAAVALLIAAAGIYGVIAFSVTQRTREIGVRVALGARRADVVIMIVRQAVTFAVIGIVLGLGGALAAGRVLQRLLFEISASDPLTLGAASAGVLVVALAAAVVPSLRAVSIDPIESLRSD